MIQVYGTKKCKVTAKALRYFAERRVQVQFFDLTERKLSRSELDLFARKAGGLEQCVNPESASYKDRGLAHMEYDPLEELLADPSLLKTPVVRQGQELSLGEAPEFWKKLSQPV